ncbi:MAG: phage holin family protein [Verrucomicrobiae bacterium]|nr:phage holin family protein [Verrucomicrobiae bacterium]
MADETSNPFEWRESLRRIGDSLQVLVRNRLELFAVEWQEEKLRLIRLLCWLVLAGVIGSAGVLIALGALACWLWSRTGYLGVIGLVLLCLAATAVILWKLTQQLRSDAVPFAHTVEEFRKDNSCLKNRD